MDILCVIPARGGSKRVPNKNMAEVGGKPMLWWTIQAALGAGLHPWVSSESDEILSYAIRHGAFALCRPLELATDESSTESVLLHADAATGYKASWVMTLPPTSPLRTADTIRKVLETGRWGADALMTVTDYRGDLWERHGTFLRRAQAGAPRRQQDRNPSWEENSAVYMTKTKILHATQSILGYGDVIGVPISRQEAWDVNDHLDLLVADALLRVRSEQQLPCSPSPAS
jgi:CMP-N,N'-diacetyllegionaminic acid synthase